MKTLLRLCSAAALAAALTACGEMPTATQAETAPARRGGGVIGGGYDAAGRDTATVNTATSDQTTTDMRCYEERGGVFMGGGYLVDPCQGN